VELVFLTSENFYQPVGFDWLGGVLTLNLSKSTGGARQHHLSNSTGCGLRYGAGVTLGKHVGGAGKHGAAGLFDYRGCCLKLSTL